jgi:hypothetical protein
VFRAQLLVTPREYLRSSTVSVARQRQRERLEHGRNGHRGRNFAK